MYEAVLVPTDGSDASRAAVDQGVAIADRFDATVHFLYVVDLGAEMSAAGVGEIAGELTDAFESMASNALEEAETRAEEAGVDHRRTTREGFPHEAIAEYVTDHGIDLVVVGATGRSGVAERLLGSTTDRVIRSVETSVMVARS